MKEFIRNFKKQQTVGLLNICSLSLGIMVAIVIGLWTINELSFDRFHKNNDRIYRTVLTANLSGNPVQLGSTFRPFGDDAKEEFPVIEDMCRILIQKADVTIDDKLHQQIASFVTDSNFFNFFTFSLKEGESNQVLSSPDRMVISESAAKRFFFGQDAIGQTIKFWGLDFAVSGIMYDMPKNSSIQAEFVFPMFGWYAENGWGIWTAI